MTTTVTRRPHDAEMIFASCEVCGSAVPRAPGAGRPRRYCGEDCQRAGKIARQRERRSRREIPATTVTFGTNADLIATVAGLYLSPGDTVADVTYSSGRFWKKVNLSRYQFLPSDLMPPAGSAALACDFRALPYPDGSVDALILDPPYIHSPGKGMLNTRYNGLATTDMITYAEIIQLYQDGMTEAVRVLRDGGQLWVKCKDTLASERQRWSHITIYELAQALSLYGRDLFLLVPPAPSSVTTGRWSRQIHARKVHSYLWIFETGGYRRRH